MIDGQHFGGLKSFGENARHDQPVLQHVGNAAGSANVIFQDVKLTGLGIADQIDPADMRKDSARNFHTHHFATEMRTGVNQRTRNSAVFQNALLAIDVLQEKIQRQDPLGEAAIDVAAIPNSEGSEESGRTGTGARCRGRRYKP